MKDLFSPLVSYLQEVFFSLANGFIFAAHMSVFENSALTLREGVNRALGGFPPGSFTGRLPNYAS